MCEESNGSGVLIPRNVTANVSRFLRKTYASQEALSDTPPLSPFIIKHLSIRYQAEDLTVPKETTL